MQMRRRGVLMEACGVAERVACGGYPLKQTERPTPSLAPGISSNQLVVVQFGQAQERPRPPRWKMRLMPELGTLGKWIGGY